MVFCVGVAHSQAAGPGTVEHNGRHFMLGRPVGGDPFSGGPRPLFEGVHWPHPDWHLPEGLDFSNFRGEIISRFLGEYAHCFRSSANWVEALDSQVLGYAEIDMPRRGVVTLPRVTFFRIAKPQPKPQAKYSERTAYPAVFWRGRPLSE